MPTLSSGTIRESHRTLCSTVVWLRSVAGHTQPHTSKHQSYLALSPSSVARAAIRGVLPAGLATIAAAGV